VRKRTMGGLLVIVGVILVPVGAVASIPFKTVSLSVGDPIFLLIAAGLGLLGAGVALLSADGPIFGGMLARWGLKTLAFGLVGDFVIFAMLALPGLERSNAMVLIIPFLVIGWATVIGAGMTALALLLSEGRPRKVGAVFLVVPVALSVANSLTNTLSGGDLIRLLAIAVGVVAAGALLAGFVGLALLAIYGPGDPHSSVTAATQTATP